jgi:hypothetical protein
MNFISEPVTDLQGAFGTIADDGHFAAVSTGQIDIEGIVAIEPAEGQP